MTTALLSHPDAIDNWREAEREVFGDVFQPAPHLTPSEWADRHRVITQGPMRGQAWSMEMTPYLVEILDFIGAPWARRGVVRKSTRVGYTEGVLMNAFGWTVAMDPCPIAIVQPTDEEAKGFSKEQVDPFLDLNPIVGQRFGEMGIRSADSTMTFRKFPGGYLVILGAVKDTNMRRRSAKRMLIDEVDGMRMASTEGDPLLRFQKRTDDYADDAGVMLVGSTPSVKGASRIDREFEKSDQRFYHVPCPHCHELQVLRWGTAETPFGIKWDREICCKGCGVIVEGRPEKCPDCGRGEFTTRHLPETAYYQCEHCGKAIDEADKEEAVDAGRFIPTKPLGEIPGWHIDALISKMPAARWALLVADFLAAGDDETDLQVFWNTVLGLAWTELGKKIKEGSLEARAEEYADATGAVVDVPAGVGVLTAFVDVQDSWLELLVRGWGLEEESWDIIHQRIAGSPDTAHPWQVLEGYLIKRYRNVHGGEMPILCTLIDAAYDPDKVYKFVKPRAKRLVFASMGDKTGDPNAMPLRKPLKANASGVRVCTLGTYRLKTTLFQRLALTTPGPRYMHLRGYNSERCNGFDAEYFAQFDAEEKVKRMVKGSRVVRSMYMQTRRRNEAIDLHVGNIAALMVIGGVRENMPAWIEAAKVKVEPQPAPAEKEAPERKDDWVGGQRRGGGGGSWANGWR